MCDMENIITEAEAELYDRQIRLWGLDSQNKLKHSNVLLIGMSALGAEIAKNIVLAGIASLSIVDDEPRAESVVRHTKELNPMVCIKAVSLTDNDIKNSATKYDVIILETELSSLQIERWILLGDNVAKLDPTNRPHFICASAIALSGFTFVDLGLHEFLLEDVVLKKKNVDGSRNSFRNYNQSPTEIVLNKKILNYSPISSSLGFTWSNNSQLEIQPKHVSKGYFLFRVLQKCSMKETPYSLSYLQSKWESVAAELVVDQSLLSTSDLKCCSGPLVPAINPVLGGIVSQEIIRSITRKGAPHGNWYFLNGLECSVTADWLPPLKE